jgi:hypothetical protein
MENRELNSRGPFGDDDLDPIIFVESNDTPEMRDAVRNIPRPQSDESYMGPKIGRRERLEDSLNQEEDEDATEWVPDLEVSATAKIANAALEIVGKLILAAIPLSLAALFILYSVSER